MRSAASAIACSPELQKRLIVIAGTVSGNPARSADWRAILLPDSPSGMAHPRITSSTASFACGYLSSRARITMVPKSSGRVVRSDPLGAFPTAVRKQSTITASPISILPINSATASRSSAYAACAPVSSPVRTGSGTLPSRGPADTAPIPSARRSSVRRSIHTPAFRRPPCRSP